MPSVTTADGTEIFYKDWGTGQPIVFHHGWPLSADDWDNQMLFFLGQGYRVIAHDRRAPGRPTRSGPAVRRSWRSPPRRSPTGTRSTAATRPAAARSRAMSPATVKVASPRPC